MAVSSEQIFDRVAELLVANYTQLKDIYEFSDLTEMQKVVRGGQITVAGTLGVNSNERVVLFRSDAKANEEDKNSVGVQQILSDELIEDDNLQNAILHIANTEDNQVLIYLRMQNGNGILTDYNISDTMNPDLQNPLNLGQFISFEESNYDILPEKAKEILDTDIFELIKKPLDWQKRINNFFSEWNELKGQLPDFSLDVDDDTIPDSWNPSEIEPNQDTYSDVHDVSKGGNYITRLNKHANSENVGKTLQSLYTELTNYLSDINKPVQGEMVDDRPEYENKSEGFLKIRHLNQGIIVRKQEGVDIGLERETLIPTTHPLFPQIGTIPDVAPSYLIDGFTISIWVKFLDRTNKGTLFNYGNPLRSKDPRGFRLETYVLNKNEYPERGGEFTWGEIAEQNYTGNQPFFQNNDYERFIRLVLIDHYDSDGGNNSGKIYDSHIGIPGFSRRNYIPEFGSSNPSTPYVIGNEYDLLTHTRVPIDFNEWYFVVANFNPYVNDDYNIAVNNNFQQNSNYWNGNVGLNNQYTHYSGYGSKCKVEIISKSDLLRARGYKTS